MLEFWLKLTRWKDYTQKYTDLILQRYVHPYVFIMCICAQCWYVHTIICSVYMYMLHTPNEINWCLCRGVFSNVRST